MGDKCKLRDYQEDLIKNARAALKTHKRIIVQAQVGSGKTLVFSYLSKMAAEKGNTVLILSNRTELLLQSGGSLLRVGVEAEYISPKHKKIPSGNVVVAMAQTLRRRIEKPDWQEWIKKVSLCILDEAHTSDSDFIFDYISPECYVMGFTATPKRSGKQKQLGLLYNTIIEAVETQTLIDRGFLCNARYFTVDAPDLSGVGYNQSTGDYKEREMGDVFDSPRIYAGVINNWKKICPGSKTLCFCSSQEHTIKTAIEFEKAGVPCKYLISGFSKDDSGYDLWRSSSRLTGTRSDVLKEFHENKFPVLINNGILVAGYDEPGIETVIMNRATLSLTTYIQCLGRGSRPFSGKEYFNVLDFGGNVARHGLYENKFEWSLWYDSKEGGGVMMTKECPLFEKDKNGKSGCGRLIPITYGECPFCHYVFATPQEIREVELSELINGEFKFKDMTPQQLSAYAELHGYKKSWVFRKLFYSSEDKRQFAQGMRTLGYNYKFIYRTYERLTNFK